MKKIVGIIAALAMVAGVAFADDPSVVPSLVEFKGSADFGWKADLDNETHGMYNNNSASLKIKFIPKEVKKATAGDPLWGEIEIQTNDEANELAAGATLKVPTVKVNKAKIHFVDGDFFVHMDILGPKLGLDGIKGPLAVETEKDFGSEEAGDKAGTPNGFTINFGVPVVSFNVSFADNGEDANWGASETPVAVDPKDPTKGTKFTTKSKKNYSFLADATIKPITDLSIYAGIAMSTTEKKDKLAFGANAKYKFAIDDTLSLIPAVAFHAYDFKTQKLGASLLFKWGPDGKEPGFLALKPANMSIGNKCTSGASVYFTKTLDAKDAAGKAIDDGAFGFAVYDNTLMSLIGEDAGDLSLAAKFTTTTADFGKGTLALAAAYSNTLLKDSDLPIGLTAKVSFGLDLNKDAPANANGNTAVAYELGLSQKTLIEFTELYIKYNGSVSEIAGADNKKKGVIDIGCKISL